MTEHLLQLHKLARCFPSHDFTGLSRVLTLHSIWHSGGQSNIIFSFLLDLFLWFPMQRMPFLALPARRSHPSEPHSLRGLCACVGLERECWRRVPGESYQAPVTPLSCLKHPGSGKPATNESICSFRWYLSLSCWFYLEWDKGKPPYLVEATF